MREIHYTHLAIKMYWQYERSGLYAVLVSPSDVTDAKTFVVWLWHIEGLAPYYWG